jgi:hypothetical protein
MLPEGALEIWRFTAAEPMRVDVFPDGCRDLLVSVAQGYAPRCHVSALADGIDSPTFVEGST